MSAAPATSSWRSIESQLERCLADRPQQLDALRSRRSPVGLSAPDLERPIDERAQFGPTLVGVHEHRLVGDQLRVRVEPEESEAPAHRIEIDIGERDGVARDRREVGLPVGQLAELLDQGVLAGGGLLERTARQALAGVPRSGAVTADLAGLHLDDEQAAIRVADDDVRLALVLVAVVAHEPADVREDEHLRPDDSPKSVHDEAFCCLATRRDRVVTPGCDHGAPGDRRCRCRDTC